MKQTSPAATGTAGAVIAALVAVIAIINTRFKLGLSSQDQVSIAVGSVVSAHWVAQQVAAYAQTRGAAPVATTFTIDNAAAGTKVMLTGDGGASGGGAAPQQ